MPGSFTDQSMHHGNRSVRALVYSLFPRTRAVQNVAPEGIRAQHLKHALVAGHIFDSVNKKSFRLTESHRQLLPNPFLPLSLLVFALGALALPLPLLQLPSKVLQRVLSHQRRSQVQFYHLEFTGQRDVPQIASALTDVLKYIRNILKNCPSQIICIGVLASGLKKNLPVKLFRMR